MHPVWRGPSASLASVWDAGQELMQPLCRALFCEDVASFAPWEVHLDAATARARGLRDFTGVLAQLCVSRRGHAVPPWSTARMVWKTLLLPHGDREVCLAARDGIHKLCAQVQRVRTVPAQLNASWMVTVDKRTKLVGPARFRRLELLDPIGAAWATAHWSRVHCVFCRFSICLCCTASP